MIKAVRFAVILFVLATVRQEFIRRRVAFRWLCWAVLDYMPSWPLTDDDRNRLRHGLSELQSDANQELKEIIGRYGARRSVDMERDISMTTEAFQPQLEEYKITRENLRVLLIAMKRLDPALVNGHSTPPSGEEALADHIREQWELTGDV